MSSTKINLGKVALTPKGEWNAATTYERLDVVSYQGSSYTVLKECIGQTPSEGEYYSLLASKGAKGDKGDSADPVVNSFKGRTGAVIPEAGDYTPEMVGAAPFNHDHNIAYYMKHEIDSFLESKSNPNILHNWYLIDPIDQQGVTSIGSGLSYWIDRWLGEQMELTTDGIKPKADSPTGYIIQRLEPKLIEALNGRFVTLSCLVNGILYSGTLSYHPAPEGTNYYFFTNESVHTAVREDGSILLWCADNSTIIQAVKLELGNCQTLAHKINDTWILNDLPNNALELLKCQRYYYQSWTRTEPNWEGIISKPAITTHRLLTVDFPVEMRAIPTITIFSAKSQVVAGSEPGVVTEWTTDKAVENIIGVYANEQRFTPGKIITTDSVNFTAGKYYAFHYVADANL